MSTIPVFVLDGFYNLGTNDLYLPIPCADSTCIYEMAYIIVKMKENI